MLACFYLNFRTVSHFFVLWYRVGDDNSFKIWIINTSSGIATEYAVSTNGVDFFGARFLQFLGGQTKRATRVRHVVD